MASSRMITYGIVILLSALDLWAEPVPVGPQIQVNQITTGRQLNPAVAHLVDDLFVVVWEGEDSDGRGIFGRRISRGGGVGNEFQVSVTESGDQTSTEVASVTSGDFIVVWEHDDYPNPPTVHSRRYSSTGAPSGVVTIAPTEVDHSAYLPSITSPDGNAFVVVWEDYFPGSNSFSFDGRFLDGAGQTQGAPFNLVALGTDESLNDLRISPRNGTGFSLSWDFSDLSDDEIRIQAFDTAGSATSAVFSGGDSGSDEIHTSLDDGGFLVVWDELVEGLQRRRFAGDGTPAATVDVTDSAQDQRDPHAVALPGGRAAITWSQSSSGQPTRILLQVVDADDNVEAELLVDEVAAFAFHPQVAYSADRNELVVVWNRTAPGGDQEDVRLQRYAFDAIFADGFESGDTSAW